MPIAFAPGVLRWRVLLPASRHTVWELLTTDAGRERFWAESSSAAGDRVSLAFPDGTTTTLELLRVDRPVSLQVRYFDTLTTFTLDAVDESHTLLDVAAHDVNPSDAIEVAGGWVSVLLCLKAHLIAGVDLRNHDARYSWREGFVDN